MNRDQIVQAMEDKQPVWAVYATERWRGPHARGRIVSYCDAPSVCIETETGEKVWWRADLTRPTTLVEVRALCDPEPTLVEGGPEMEGLEGGPQFWDRVAELLKEKP